MRHFAIERAWRCVPLVMLLSGCVSSMGPATWESGYRQVSVVTTEEGDALRQAILPNTCWVSPGEKGVVPLPPGCANDLNLQWMVERPRDLLRGREMGPARAGPVGAAANEYLDSQRPRGHQHQAGAE